MTKRNPLAHSILAALGALTATAAQAATITVDSADDTTGTGACTLRDAITAANTNAVVGGCAAGDDATSIDTDLDGAGDVFGDEIGLSGISGQTISLASSLPAIIQNTGIVGASVTVDGGGSVQPLSLTSATSALRLDSITVQNGSAINGGGLYVTDSATLAVSNSTFTSNTASGYGGGIHMGLRATLWVEASSFSSNSAGNGGGGIYIDRFNNAYVERSTFTGNTASGVAGGLGGNYGGLISVRGSTFIGNSAGTVGGGVYGHGGYGSTLSIVNSTLSGNTASTTGSAAYVKRFVTFDVRNSILANSAGSNCHIDGSNNNTITFMNTLVEDGTCDVVDGVDGNLTGDPLLGLLRDNGGPTLTIEPLEGSPVLDAAVVEGDGSCAGEFTDQRGETRPRAADESGSSDCDLGAVEFNPAQESASIEVNTLAVDDDGLCGDLTDGFDCSIREAINLANSDGTNQSTITFADAATLGVTPGDSVTVQFVETAEVLSGNNALPAVDTTITIVGPDDFYLALDSTEACDRRLIVVNTASGDLSLSDFMISGSCNASGGGSQRGGAILVEENATLSLARMTLTDNSADSVGGAVASLNGAEVTISSSTISRNSTSKGGGFSTTDFASVLVEDSTFSANEGGAFYMLDLGSASIVNSTFFDNRGTTSGVRVGYDSTITITNSVISGYNGRDCFSGSGSIVTFTNSLIADGRCGVVNGVDGNITGDPMLGPLQDNGGSTETHLPLDGSPVIDAVAASGGLCAGSNTDQRGATRPDDGDGVGGIFCDMGAVEVTGDIQVGSNFTVNATGDSDDGICGTGIGECTLREAMDAANADADASEITFDNSVFGSAQTITLAMGELAITTETTISGPGADLLTIDANRASRLLRIDDGNLTSPSDVSISGLSLVNGSTSDDGGAINSAEPLNLSDVVLSGNTANGYGGAIYTSTDLRLTSSQVDSNRGNNYAAGIHADLDTGETLSIVNSAVSANNSRGYYGSAVHVEGNGVLSIDNSVFTQNQAYVGGALTVGGTTDATISQSTFASNSGRGAGGAVAISTGATNTVTFNNSTFYNNNGQARGGAILMGRGNLVLNHASLVSNRSSLGGAAISATNTNSPTITLRSTILADGTSDLCFFQSGVMTSGTNNLATDDSCGGVGAAETTNSALNLGPLASNGGSTETVFPGPGSVAVDAVASVGSLCEGMDSDQRGIPRPLAAGGIEDCDIGAVEVMNDPVVAMTDRFTVSEDATILNNTDIDGTATPANSSDDGVLVGEDSADDEDEGITVSEFGGVAAGNTLTLASGATLTIAVDGSFAFSGTGFYESLGVGETDTEAVDYTATDGYSSDTASLIIDIAGSNDSPVAEDVAVEVNEGEEVTAGYAGSDVDANDTLAFTLSGFSPLFSDNTDGTFTFDANQPPFQSLNLGDTDSASIGFTVTDGSGAVDSGTITVTVNGQNDAPVAIPVSELAAAEDSTTPGNFNATDVDNDTADLTFEVTVQPSAGSVTPTTGEGFDFDPNGQFETLATGESSTVGFTFRVTDPGGLSSSSTGTIRVDGANDAPVANDDGYITDQSTPLNVAAAIGLLANDSDIDISDSLSLVDASVVPVSGPGGSLVAASDGSFTYTPPADTNGLDVFTYEITDGTEQSTATVTIRVGLDNQAPAAFDDAYVIDENTTLTVDAPGVLDNDSDPEGNPLSVNSAGTFVAQGIGGMVTLNADGSFDYAPPANTSGDATFLYTITDGFGNQDSATITITVSNIDDAPNAEDDLLAPVLEDSGLQAISASALLSNDDAGVGDTTDSIRITGVSAVAGVSATLNDGGTPDPMDDTVQVTPLADFFGEASFTYTIEDDAGTPAMATARIGVLPVNDPPQFSLLGDQSFNAGTAGVQTIDGFVNVTSLGPNEMIQMVQRIDVVTISDSNGVVDLVSIDDTGRLSLVLSGANGVATFDVTVTDNGGVANGGDNTAPSQTFTVSVGQELETLFSDGFETPVINKSFDARKTMLSTADLSARVSHTDKPVLVLRARKADKASYLEVYARRIHGKVELQMVRFEQGQLTAGNWNPVREPTVTLAW